MTTMFEIAMDAYKEHIRREIGYSALESTVILIGFTAGWEAHRDLIDNPSEHFHPPHGRIYGISKHEEVAP